MASSGAGIPTLMPRITELYGASGGALRVGEAESYMQDLDELEREEIALENTVQELVNRRAAVPIGVKFHREGAASTLQQEVATGSEVFRESKVVQKSEGLSMGSSSSAEEEEEEEEEEDMDEDEMMVEDEEDDGETTGRATIVRGEAQQRGDDSFARDMELSDDSFAREIESDDDLMEVE
ncbi:unnamed protein product [Peronospora destructor]|uniref:Uncharacterized protein n=1 Tax=Peronospora destructor TaxID=86335 RepID=A0AAV0VHN6_9STRA|nr:unnamed protein product [Peronospora destructor]CAI5747096.1 unnamed protein product [Peronospora destructor]